MIHHPAPQNDHPPPDRRNQQERLADTFQSLYAVVVGLAVTTAIAKLLNVQPGILAAAPAAEPLLTVRWDLLGTVLAFFVTVIPMYHGSYRQLDVIYTFTDADISASQARVGRVRVFVDFIFSLTHAIILFGMALVLDAPRTFAQLFAALLLFQCVWAATTTGFTWKESSHATHPWLKVNLVALLATALVLVGIPVLEQARQYPVTAASFQLLVLAIALVRTVWDYRSNWSLYWP